MKTTEQILVEIDRYIQKINYEDEKFGAGQKFGLIELKEFILSDNSEPGVIAQEEKKKCETYWDTAENSQHGCEHEWVEAQSGHVVLSKCIKCAEMR